jgi:hypothetical protein
MSVTGMLYGIHSAQSIVGRAPQTLRVILQRRDMARPGGFSSKANAVFESAMEKVRLHFELQLTPLGLSAEEINRQSLEELEQSLERVNEAIKNYQSFGVIKLKASAEIGFYITTSSSDALYEVTALPLLLERKKMILDRVRSIKGERKIESIQDLIKTVSDEELRVKLEREVDVLKTESQQLQQEAKEVEQARQQQSAKTKEELDRIAVEVLERRSKVWRSFLERESVATIIGSLLLVIITIAMLVAMFAQLPTSDIVNNAFLLILGYFFGQTINKATSTAD